MTRVIPVGYQPEVGSRWVLSKKLRMEWEVVEYRADVDQVLLEQKTGLVGAMRRPTHLASSNLQNGGQIPARIRRWVPVADLIPVKE